MRFEGTVSDAQPSEKKEPPIVAKSEPLENAADKVNLSGDSAVDTLQATVYRAGMRLVPILQSAQNSLEKTSAKKAASESEEKMDPIEMVNTALKELGHFAYNVGFAGEQSCGKSTVVNSLLQYPLMPTCQGTTTASVVQIVYSDHFRVRAMDDDTKKTVLDYDCEMPKNPAAQKKFRERFDTLLDYAISAMDVLVIENFQYFTDAKVGDKRITVKDVELSPDDPKHVMLLLFILLGVYVGQNDPEWNEEKRQLMEKRRGIFAYLGIPKDTVNISVKSQGKFEMLKSGLVITDLPGLGASAEQREDANGRTIKGHNEITEEAIQDTDAMAFLTTPENREAGYKVLPAMLSSAKLKETVYKGDRIFPILNKADTCKGEQSRKTVLQSFCTALAAANVEKKPEEIRLYSGILGEYKFEGIPFERTLYFRSRYDEESVRHMAECRHREYEEAKEDKISELQYDMEKLYAQSGIEELLEFFRTSYIEVGKYNKSTSALQALRAMVMSIASELGSTAKVCQNRLTNRATVQARLVEGLKNAVTAPLTRANYRVSVESERFSQDTRENLNDNKAIIVQMYSSAFEKALKEYKEKLLSRLGKFQLNVGGFSDNARIDVAGSVNRNHYHELEKEYKDFPISMLEVNEQYGKILKKVRTRIDRFYSDAIDNLTNVRDEIRQSMDDSINAAKESISAEELKALEAVKNQLLDLVEKQIEIVKINLEQHRQEETDVMNNVLSAISGLNKAMTEGYAKKVQSQLASKTSDGMIFKKRDYLLIDGPDGMKVAVYSLQLSQEDAQNLSLNLDSDVDTIIYQAICRWTDTLSGIAGMYFDLQHRLEKPLQETIDVMAGTVEDSQLKLEATKKQLLKWYEICHQFNEEVHPALEAARAQMKDREDSNLWLLENIFYKCFDKEVEEEYGRVRNA